MGLPHSGSAARSARPCPTSAHTRVMLERGEIHAAVPENPVAFHEFFVGKRLACLVVDLPGSTLTQLREVLAKAWLRKPPIPVRDGFTRVHEQPDVRPRSPRSRRAGRTCAGRYQPQPTGTARSRTSHGMRLGPRALGSPAPRRTQC